MGAAINSTPELLSSNDALARRNAILIS